MIILYCFSNALKALFDVDSVAALNEAKRLAPLPAKGSLAVRSQQLLSHRVMSHQQNLILSRF